MKIAVAGIGYVGLSIAVLWAQYHQVVAVDIVPEKIELINARKSPIKDEYIEKYLAEVDLDLKATLDGNAGYVNADYVIITVPTNYDCKKKFLDTFAVDSVIQQVMTVNPETIIVLEFTVPVGYTDYLRKEKGIKKILFCPEFLRESKALYDNLYPSRIIVGTDTSDVQMLDLANSLAKLLTEGAIKENIDTLIMGYMEAEAVKLFANTYLAPGSFSFILSHPKPSQPPCIKAFSSPFSLIFALFPFPHYPYTRPLIHVHYFVQDNI